MLNDEMNNLLKQTKTNIDVIEVDTQSTITDNLKVLYGRLKMLNKNILTKSGNEEIMNMLNLSHTKTDVNSIHLTELKDTSIQF